MSARVLGAALLIAALLTATGCVRVRPWERELLARPDMAWEPDALESIHRGHVAFSKEGAMPDGGAGGGGCGCN